VWSPPGIWPSPWADDLEDWAVEQNLTLTMPPGIPTRRGEGNQRDTMIDLIWTNAAAVLEDSFQEPTINFVASLGSDHTSLWTAFQHILESAIAPPPQLSQFIIADNAHDRWIQRFLEVSPQTLPTLTSTAEIDQEASQLTVDIERTSMNVFEAWKGYSPRGASWWNNACDLVVLRVREAQDPETWKVADKDLQRMVRTAKCEWADEFLCNATPECLWTAARWHFRWKQRLIPALLTETGLTDQPTIMTEALRKCFFKEFTTEVPLIFLDDPPRVLHGHMP
jgi:hypothetical protein